MRPLWVKYDGDEAVTDYQVRCVLTSSDIPFEKLRSDKNDILFVNKDNEVIPYWIEKIDNDEIIVWLKFPQITPGKEVFWLYYGNGNFQGYASSGDDIFIFFDDFEDYPIGSHPSKWIDGDIGDGYSKVTNTTSYHGTKCLVQNAKEDGARISKIADGGPWGNVAVSSMYYDRGGLNVVLVGTYEPADDPASDGNEWVYLRHNTSNYVYREVSDGGDTGNTDTGIPRKVNQWVRFEFRYFDGELKLYIDGQLVHSTTKVDNVGRILLKDWWASTDDDYHDLVIVRKYVEPEPTIIV